MLRDNTWLQPIAEIVACYYGGPSGCAIADAYLTRLNGGSIDQALVAGVVTEASFAATSAVATEHWNFAGTAAADGAIGGTASSLTGGSFTRGFEFAAAGSLLSSGYKNYVGHSADWSPGQNYPTPMVPCADPNSNCYDPTSDYAIPEEDYSKNTFGLDRMLTGGDGECWYQSGPCSIFADHVPGLQAVSQFHDTWMIQLIYPTTFANFASMPFAAAITYGALVGGSYYLSPMLNVGRH